MFIRNWVKREKLDGDGNDLDGASATDGVDNDVDNTPDGNDGGKTTKDVDSDVLAAISSAVRPTETDAGKADKAPADNAQDTSATTAATTAATTSKAGDPTKNPGVAAAPTKTTKDFEMPEAERAILGPKAQQRFQSLIEHSKSVEENYQRLRSESAELAAARDGLMSTFREFKVESADDLMPLLELNAAMKRHDFAAAMELIKPVYETLSSHLGLADSALNAHPDLKMAVDEGGMPLQTALETARLRNEKAFSDRGREAAIAEQKKKDEADAVLNKYADEVTRWEREMQKTDVDYKQKSDKILQIAQDVFNKYPPELWLTTLKTVYAQLPVVKRVEPPIQRSRGPNVGAPETTDVETGIRLKLGYPPPR